MLNRKRTYAAIVSTTTAMILSAGCGEDSDDRRAALGEDDAEPQARSTEEVPVPRSAFETPADARDTGVDPNPSGAIPGDRQEPPDTVEEDSEAALEQAQTAVDEGSGDLTQDLRDLALALPQLSGEDRLAAEALLARPTEGANDPDEEGYTAQYYYAASSAHFCYFWVRDTADAPPLADANGRSDADGIPDFIEDAATYAETSFGIEHGQQLGWAFPKSDGNRGCSAGDGGWRVDIYVADLGPKLFGYATTDPDTTGSARPGFLVVNKDYSALGYDDYHPALAVTLAHEYNHVIQFAYDFDQDDWMWESTATWIEEKVFPDVNDWTDYVSSFASETEVPLTDGESRKQYGLALWNHWLTSRYGDSIPQEAWASSLTTSPASLATAAYDAAVRSRASEFAREFSQFSAAAAELRASPQFPDAKSLDNVERVGTLKPGSTKKLRLKHTTFALLRVKAKGRRAVALKVKAPRGTRSAIALVGRSKGGAVRTALRDLPKGGTGKVRLKRPAQFKRITAVVVNADASINRNAGSGGWLADVGDWSWTRDRSRYSANLRAG